MIEGPQGLFLTRTPRNLRVSAAATVGRWALIGLLAAVSAGTAARTYLGVRPYRLLASKGTLVEADVVSLAYVPGPPAAFKVQYRFEAADSFTYSGEEVVPTTSLKEINADEPIELTYYAPDPTLAAVGRVTGARVCSEATARAHYFILAIATAAAAVWIVLSHRRRTWLLRYGAVVPGTVTGKGPEHREGPADDENEKGSPAAQDDRFVVRYKFTPEHRDELSCTAQVTEEAFEKLREGSTQLVFYDRARPERYILYAASNYEIDEI